MTNSHAPNLLVSVIIPVFNDSDRLKLCLTALEQQTLPKELYEIIVVDNASQEDIKHAAQSFPQVKVICEEQPGSYVARNAGVAIAQGTILAFTDSDCIPAATWLEHGINCLKSTANCGLVGGNIELFFRKLGCPTAVELYESLEMSFPQEQFVKERHFAVTANLFTFKSVIDQVGSFNASLKSGGDKEWGNRVFQAGYAQAYAKDASVGHPARHSFQELYKRVTRIDGGLYDISKNTTSRSVILKSLVSDIVLAFTPPVRKFSHIWSDPRLTNLQQKLQYTNVMLFIRYISAWERIRLKLGGESRRW